MIAILNKHLLRFKQLVAPKIELVYAKWLQLQPREQKLIGIMAGVIVALTLFTTISGMINYKNGLVTEVSNLNSFTLYSLQAARSFKDINKIEANTFNDVSLEQIKGDVAQVLQVKDPDILIQDGQMTVNVPNAEFSQVLTLLEQLRRSYAIFPSQLSIIRQSRSGFISFTATFWVKQQ